MIDSDDGPRVQKWNIEFKIVTNEHGHQWKIVNEYSWLELPVHPQVSSQEYDKDVDRMYKSVIDTLNARMHVADCRRHSSRYTHFGGVIRGLSYTHLKQLVPEKPNAAILLDQVKDVGLMTEDGFNRKMNDGEQRVTRTTIKGYDKFLPSDCDRIVKELKNLGPVYGEFNYQSSSLPLLGLKDTFISRKWDASEYCFFYGCSSWLCMEHVGELWNGK